MNYVNSKFAIVSTSFLLSTRFYFIQILPGFCPHSPTPCYIHTPPFPVYLPPVPHVYQYHAYQP